MILEFEKSFSKSLDKIKDPTFLKKLRSIIIKLEKAADINDIQNIKKLSGFKNYYRLRIGSYRLGFEKLMIKE